MGSASGTKLGRYEVIKHLANGGMAQVLLARVSGIEGFERYVVVKRIHSDRANDPAFVKMFLDEARLAAALHHTNIVQVHDIGQEQGEYFFAMDYIHGEDLRKLLRALNQKQQVTPLEHVVSIVTAAASALHYAHEQRGSDRKPLGLVHRDVTPANILIGYDGNVKVVDFGIAKAALRSTETKTGTLKGKVAYMAPEQCVGKPVDRRSDIFALGIVLWELTTVRRLFKGDNDFLVMNGIVQGNIPPPSKYRPDVPPGLEAIILKALSQKPENRFQTADELRIALDRFASQQRLHCSVSGLAAYMKEHFGERLEPWLVDEDEPEIQLTVDFDGSASAVVELPVEALEELAIPQILEPTPSAPIMRARRKAITDGLALKKGKLATAGIPIVPKRKTPPPFPVATPIASAAPRSRPGVPTEKLPSEAAAPVEESFGGSEKSGTPMAWSVGNKPAATRSRRSS